MSASIGLWLPGIVVSLSLPLALSETAKHSLSFFRTIFICCFIVQSIHSSKPEAQEYSHKREENADFLLCRNCGHEIVQAQDLIRKPSGLALRQRNDTILGVKGVLIQLFENPQGSRFEVITSRKADLLTTQEQPVFEHSWFPGHSWKVSFCPKCGAHLGWHFHPHAGLHDSDQADDSKFSGLILNNLLHNEYADNLLMTPKTYSS